MTAPRFRIRLAGTASLTPGPAVTTAALIARHNLAISADDAEQRSGIRERHFADPSCTSADLGAEVLRLALDDAGLSPERLERIIFVSSLGGDFLSPATANLVAAQLGLRNTCDCFDLSNACMGFLTAFDIATRALVTGSGPVGVVVVELGSRYMRPDDPRPFLVLGDAVAAAVLDRGEDDEGVLGCWLRNDGVAFGNAYVAHPGLTHVRETVRFTAPSKRMLGEAVDAVRQGATAVLAQAGLTLADVQWVLPHQPNGTLLAGIREALAIPPERIVPVVQEIGSVGSASIPVSLDRLLRTYPVRPGDRILMAGVGAGIGSGALLFQLGAWRAPTSAA